ncbi:MAG: hypothetical protein AABX37_04745 [Nanoarchaeota archaeon]
MSLDDILQGAGRALRRARDGIMYTARGARDGSGWIAEQVAEYRTIQEQRDELLRDDPAISRATLPYYGEGRNILLRGTGKGLHAYHEQPRVRRGVHAGLLYSAVGVGGNIVSRMTGEPTWNTVIDMAAPAAGVGYYFSEHQGRWTIMQNMGLYALCAIAGWDASTELAAHPGTAGFLASLRDYYQTFVGALPFVNTPGQFGAVVGLATPAVSRFVQGQQNAQQARRAATRP